MKNLDEKLTKSILQACAKAKTECGANTEQLEKQLQQKGAATILKQLCRQGAVSQPFETLSQKKRLELSPEAIAAKGEFAELFSDNEADWFLQVLCEAEYF